MLTTKSRVQFPREARP
jgi:hypothetical protein